MMQFANNNVIRVNRSKLKLKVGERFSSYKSNDTYKKPFDAVFTR